MGSPDIVTPELCIDLKTVEIPTKIMPLRSLRSIHPRFPRKLKKRLKEYHGKDYKNWLNSPIKWIPELNPDIYSYHNVDADKELTQLLIDNENHENNKTS